MRKRAKGEEYIAYKRVNTKVVRTIIKEGRKLETRCNHNIASKKSKQSFLCANVKKEKRQEIFNY